MSVSVLKQSRRCLVYNIDSRLVDYITAWRWQRSLVRHSVAAQREGRAHEHPDSILVVQHPSVYTLGRGSTHSNLKFDPFDPKNSRHEVYRVERGGDVTWHGPGQLVMYPIFDLTQHKKDLHWYLRTIEESIIATLSQFGLVGERDEAGTGVWVDGSKIAAVGVSATRWITMHGLSLNVCVDLTGFDRIIPCGIQGRSVTSLMEQLTNQSPLDNKLPSVDVVRAKLLKEIATSFSLHLSFSESEPSFLGEDDCDLSNGEWFKKNQRPL